MTPTPKPEMSYVEARGAYLESIRQWMDRDWNTTIQREAIISADFGRTFTINEVLGILEKYEGGKIGSYEHVSKALKELE